VNDASRLEIGQAQYSAMCRPNGGVIDDLLVYRFADRWMLVVNASNREKDWEWVVQQSEGMDVDLEDRSDRIALLALQGPKARRVLAPLTETDVERIGYYRFAESRVAGAEALVAGTGYTGEDGFELYVAADDALAVWTALLDAGGGQGVVPVGLGARDSLRLEMGYALYGNDLDENHTPLEAGLGWVVKMKKGEFLGRDALARQKEAGVRERLVGFQLEERGFPRHGYIARFEGEPAGEVTSGILSPTLGKGIGLAYVTAEAGAADSAIEIMIRDKAHAAKVTRPPFYRDGSIRR
jgi:aminomethyltransferase